MRLLLLAAFLTASFLFSVAQARAAIEFCPASLMIKPVEAASQDQPAVLYGAILKALGPRIVTATLVFDTDKGWFSASAPATALTEKQYHYTGPYRTAIHSDWNSPVFYVKFPAAVHITNSWISKANTQACYPSPPAPKGLTPSSPVQKPRGDYTLDPKDEDQIDNPPAPASEVILAQKTVPPYHAACANAFRDGSITNAVSPDPGDDARMHGLSGTAYVEIDINANGTLADSWVWLSSGEAVLDNAVLWAAQHSTYENAMAYCEAVPSHYLFKATFG